MIIRLKKCVEIVIIRLKKCVEIVVIRLKKCVEIVIIRLKKCISRFIKETHGFANNLQIKETTTEADGTVLTSTADCPRMELAVLAIVASVPVVRAKSQRDVGVTLTSRDHSKHDQAVRESS